MYLVRGRLAAGRASERQQPHPLRERISHAHLTHASDLCIVPTMSNQSSTSSVSFNYSVKYGPLDHLDRLPYGMAFYPTTFIVRVYSRMGA